jgi:AraC-like DNA-binding protein
MFDSFPVSFVSRGPGNRLGGVPQDAPLSSVIPSRIGNAMTAAPLVIHHSCSDADELQEVARAWNLDLRPMKRARAASKLIQTVDPTAQLGYAHIRPQVEQRGASPTGLRTFALLGRRSPDIFWCGAPADSDTLLCFGADGAFEASSPSNFEVHTLSLGVQHFDALAATLGLGPVEQRGASAQAIRLLPTQAEALRTSLERLTSAIEANASAAASPAVRETLEVDLPATLLRLATSGGDSRQPPGAPIRTRALRRALEFIEANAARAPRISDLCAAAGASERTLRYGFQERFGMSPKAYLQAVRLNSVRRELRNPRAGATVADAANRWGFWHMGQFAADYRRLFGELPSRTPAAPRGRGAAVGLPTPRLDTSPASSP